MVCSAKPIRENVGVVPAQEREIERNAERERLKKRVTAVVWLIGSRHN